MKKQGREKAQEKEQQKHEEAQGEQEQEPQEEQETQEEQGPVPEWTGRGAGKAVESDEYHHIASAERLAGKAIESDAHPIARHLHVAAFVAALLVVSLKFLWQRCLWPSAWTLVAICM